MQFFLTFLSTFLAITAAIVGWEVYARWEYRRQAAAKEKQIREAFDNLARTLEKRGASILTDDELN